MNRDRVRRYVERHDDATVPQVLGRFELPPSAASEVRELLGSTNRARVRQNVPRNDGEPSGASGALEEGAEEKNHQTASRYPGHPTLPGQFDTLPPKIEGGEEVRARVGWKHTGCGGVDE
jgi:hypothetical protein